MTDSRTEHFFIYPKDKQGKPTGHTICVLLRDGRMYHGEALCSKNDQFEKSVGREISLKRALFEYERDKNYKYPPPPPPPEVRHYADRYRNEIQCIYKTEATKNKGGWYDKVLVGASELDKRWTNPGKVFVEIHNDGNGYDVVHRDGKFRLPYDTAYELMLGLMVADKVDEESRLERLK